MAKKKSAKAVTSPVGEVYQLKITLSGTKPPIWRRVQVRDGLLEELHVVIQIAMGWTDSHLHEFRVGKRSFVDPGMMEDSFDEFESSDSTRFQLSGILFGGDGKKKKDKVKYVYDFGDSWEHEIKYEKKIEPESKVDYPRCLDGERACPPEDCGGVWGFADFIEAINAPGYPGYLDMNKLYECAFGPEEFSAEAVNNRLKRYC